MQEYRRIRKSQTAYRVDNLRPEMEKLQRAVKRVGENWNDVVAQGIQTTQVNMIVSSCNSVNSVLMGLATNLNSDLVRLEELVKTSGQSHV